MIWTAARRDCAAVFCCERVFYVSGCSAFQKRYGPPRPRVWGRALHHPGRRLCPPREGGTARPSPSWEILLLREPRGLPAPEELCRYAVEPDGTARLLRAFGRDLTGASHARYDLDFGDGEASTAARSGEEASIPFAAASGGAGPAREPAGHRELCLLQLPPPAPPFGRGGGADHGQRCLPQLLCTGNAGHPARPEQATGLFALVACITEAVQALFWPEGEARPSRACGTPPTGKTLRRLPRTFCSTRFRGRGTITDSAFGWEIPPGRIRRHLPAGARRG